MKKEDSKDTKLKPAEIKLDFKNLPALKPAEGYNLPKPPPIGGSSKENSDMKDWVKFSLDNENDLSTYRGRFNHQVSRINPLLFFVSESKIKECKEKLYKH